MPTLNPAVRPWFRASVAALLAVALRGLAQPLLGDQLPFVFAFPVTAFTALVWGIGPGLLAAALCAVAVALPGFPPDLPSAERPVQVGAFVLSAIVTCLLCGQFGRRPAAEGTPTDPRLDAETPLTAWLRAVLWGAFLIPATVFGLAAWWGYEQAHKDAEKTVSHASALALRHAERTLAIAVDIARRADLATTGPDAGVRAREHEVHQRLADLVAGLPSVLNLNVWDADGRPLARSDAYPLDPKATVADRAYFLAHRSGAGGPGISDVITGRQTGLKLINATIARGHADGGFNGIVAVSLSPDFFADYYRLLTAEDPDLASFALVRTDGALLSRWPPAGPQQASVARDDPVFARVAHGELAGISELPTGSGRETRLVSFRHVPGYPVYVTAGVSREAMLAGWLRFIALLAAVVVPVTFGLVCVSWVALKKTRREQAVSIELREQIRRRAKAEKAILETQKLEALSQVTGGVAHDFNNLLTIVSTNLHIFMRRHPELAGERQLESMSRAVGSGVRLTRQLLSFSRKQALRPETVELQQWLPAMEDLIASTLGRQIALEFRVETDTAPVTVDLAELELALINTAINAQHAMPDGGTLHVSARNAAPLAGNGRPMVEVRVRDDGQGIAPDNLRKVFEPFFTTKGPGKGSGLGLSQVYGLCAQAGGFAAVESTLGEGTCIRMVFPAAGPVAVAAELRPPAPAHKLVGRVLLVEDNAEVAAATEHLLRTAGLEVIAAVDAESALARVLSETLAPDVVLSDISMPGAMDGIGLAFALRLRLPGLPVLLITGFAERIDEAIAAGFRVLTKPAPPEQLLGELAALLARKPLPRTVLDDAAGV